MSTEQLLNQLYRSQIEEILERDERLERFNELLNTTYPIWKSTQSKLPYSGNLLNAGSAIVYQQEGQLQPTERKGYLSRIGDYIKRLYNRTGEWFIEKPYKGLGALGAIIGGTLGLAAGPLGVLFGGAVVGGILGGLGAGYYWAWGRGKRVPGDTEFLKDRSLGKWFMDYLQAQRGAQSQPAG